MAGRVYSRAEMLALKPAGLYAGIIEDVPVHTPCVHLPHTHHFVPTQSSLVLTHCCRHTQSPSLTTASLFHSPEIPLSTHTHALLSSNSYAMCRSSVSRSGGGADVHKTHTTQAQRSGSDQDGGDHQHHHRQHHQHQHQPNQNGPQRAGPPQPTFKPSGADSVSTGGGPALIVTANASGGRTVEARHPAGGVSNPLSSGVGPARTSVDANANANDTTASTRMPRETSTGPAVATTRPPPNTGPRPTLSDEASVGPPAQSRATDGGAPTQTAASRPSGQPSLEGRVGGPLPGAPQPGSGWRNSVQQPRGAPPPGLQPQQPRPPTAAAAVASGGPAMPAGKAAPPPPKKLFSIAYMEAIRIKFKDEISYVIPSHLSDPLDAGAFSTVCMTL